MAMTANGAELPCKNPNCKSKGQSHPNCRCYGRADIVASPSGNGRRTFSGPSKPSAAMRNQMAEGGVVEHPHFCDSGYEHDPGCEYYADGGQVRKKNSKVKALAEAYMGSKGMSPRDSHYHPVDPDRAKAIAGEFEKMEHKPNDPMVKAAYNALIKETLEQFQHVKKSGLKMQPIEAGQENPYPSGSKQVFEDIEKNNHLWFYPTDQGFGTQTEIKDHPMLRATEEKVGEKPLLANDVFRIVHDYFGHAKEGHPFGPRGEENAWMEHSKMYSPLARRALTTETRGQNSWVNYGPHGEQNRNNPGQTIYADQKAGLLPSWVSEEPKELYHYSQHPDELQDIDPQFMGTGKAGRETERENRVPRSYFYEAGTMPEDLVTQGAKRVYKVARPHNIIDIASEEAQPIVSGARDPSHMEEILRDAGYAGYKNSGSQIPGAIALFKKAKALSSEEIKPKHFKKAAGFAQGGEIGHTPSPVYAAYADGGTVAPHVAGLQILSDAMKGGMFKGHHEVSDSILGHGDPSSAVAAAIAHGGAPSLLKLGSASLFSPRVAMKPAQTAERSQKLLAGLGAARQPELGGEIEAGIEHPWFRHGMNLHGRLADFTAGNYDKGDTWALLPKKLTGRDIHGAASSFALPTAMKLLSQGASPDEIEQGMTYAEHVGKGVQKIERAVGGIFEGEIEPKPEPIDTRSRDKLHKFVSEGKLQDQMMEEMTNEGGSVADGSESIAKHFPEQNQMLQAARARVVGYLNQIRPNAQPGLPFDTQFTTRLQVRAYDAATDIANDPLSVVQKIKAGMITPTDVKAMQNMYPELYQYLCKSITEKMMDVKYKKQSVNPTTRRSMAIFMGTPLDTTMTPVSIQNVQAMYAKQRQASQNPQQQAGGAAPKKGTPHLDKVSQGAQTDSQALAARQQRPR